ncbi:MAG: hypothetical protein F6K58_19675 [Symploca sp. SIO2E9]|nr:hypothetical protein [Symploca sp. SIO2E9]
MPASKPHSCPSTRQSVDCYSTVGVEQEFKFNWKLILDGEGEMGRWGEGEMGREGDEPFAQGNGVS